MAVFGGREGHGSHKLRGTLKGMKISPCTPNPVNRQDLHVQRNRIERKTGRLQNSPRIS